MGKSVKRKGRWVVEENEVLDFLSDISWKAKLIEFLPKMESAIVRLAYIALNDPEAYITEDSDYDENPRYSLTYLRPETTEETAAREARQAANAKRNAKRTEAAKARAAEKAKQKEAAERKELERLLKKYKEK